MRAAEAAMRQMDPHVLAEMQAKMASLPPHVLAAQMDAARKLTPADVQAAQAAMASLTPEQMMAQAAAAAAALGGGAAAPAPALAKATKLKDEGNAAFKAGDTDTALAKYEAAAKAAAGVPGGFDVLLASHTNAALAALNAQRYQAAIDAATAALALIPPPASRAKALLRRGLARQGAGDGAGGVADLRAALACAPPADAAVVKAKLAEAEAALKEAGELNEAAVEAAAASAAAADKAAAVAAPRPPPAPAAAFPGAPGAGGPSPAQLRTMAAALRADPGLAARMKAQVATASPDALRAAAAAAGMPGASITPDAMEAAASSLSKMSPADLEAMADAVEKMGPMAGAPSASSVGASPTDPAAAAAAMAADPAMARAALSAVKNMNAATLAAMSGGKVTAADAEKMKEKLAGLSDEQPEQMVKMSAKLQVVAGRVRDARARLAAALRSPTVIAALLALVVALVARRLGWV